MKSLAEYILQNVADVTYKRVLAAAKKYPGHSVFEYQHGIGSVASRKYVEKHPELQEPEEWEEWEPEPEPPRLKIFCFRDYLDSYGTMYFGVNLYFCEYSEKDYFTDIQDLFAEELLTNFGDHFAYVRSELSEASDFEAPSMMYRDFSFEIKDLDDMERFMYDGHYQLGSWIYISPKFAEFFDTVTLSLILRSR